MKKELFVPGRTELAGNHTDHQNGRVLASAIALGLYAVCETNGSKMIHVQSEGFNSFDVRCDHLLVRTTEFGTPKALVRGVVSAFSELGLKVGGFNAVVKSTLPVGAGLSSSAAFSVLIGSALSALFNDGKVDPVVIARAGQEAENRYFGKPCGLMSQLVCALGHTLYVDFKTGEITPIKADFSSMGLTLCLTDTGGSHADLNDDYASVPAEMKAVARFFGRDVLCGLTKDEIIDRTGELRKVVGDRAVLRALHFISENERVCRISEYIAKGDIKGFLSVINESGRSSATVLQNYYSTKAPSEQGIGLACAIAESVMEGDGACRVHGGGFAGTAQVFVPADKEEKFIRAMECAFGKGSAVRLMVRPVGAVKVI